MISWILRDTPQGIVFIDDVLVGTKCPGGMEDKELLDKDYAEVSAVMESFRKHHLFLKAPRCIFSGHK